MLRFFVSYNSADKDWAEWIAWQLEEAGHRAVIQAWDFRPGGNFVLDMDRAAKETDKTIVVLSENYLSAKYTQSEWAGAFADDPESLERKFIPIRVRKCEPRGLLRSIVYVDLVGLKPEAARDKLFEALRERVKPDQEPAFPVSTDATDVPPAHRGSAAEPDFPNPAVTKPWNVPYERNVFFTGREAVLEDLRRQLSAGQAAAIAQATTQAISGLGGIGKTQTAVEYAYQYRDEYAAVFWVRAEAVTEVQTGFMEIARLLGLPEEDAQDPNDTVQAVKRWLAAHSDWLLIFDNADRPEALKDFRPRQLQGQSHMLLTSRAQTFDSWGIARPVSLERMPASEAVDFLFKRTGRAADDAGEQAAAATLSKELGYLPLALEQAGAYVLAQQMGFANYLKSYGKRRLTLLEKGLPVAGDYPESVATTWALNFQAVEADSTAAADLLRISAFLSPDAIPYELFEAGASEMGEALAAALADMADDPAAFAEVLAPLTRYSLVRTEPAMQAYSVARLVQEVQKAALSEEAERLWAARSIEAVAQAFPEDDYENWSRIDRLLPHARLAAQLVEIHSVDSEAAVMLLGKTGSYLHKRGLYDEAEPLLYQALDIGKRSLGDDHPDVATRLNNLALLYKYQGRYSKAEPLFLQAIDSGKRSLGDDHPLVATYLNNLALLYKEQGRYSEAEPLYRQAIDSGKRSLGDDHPLVATYLNNLALLYQAQGRYSKAEPLYRQAIDSGKRSLGNDHPDGATRINNLASLYQDQGRYGEAEPLFLQAIEIGKRSLGNDHPAVATYLNNLALLYKAQGRTGEAESLFLQVIEIGKRSLGDDHSLVAMWLNNLASLYQDQRRYSEAEPLFLQAIEIGKRSLGDDHPDSATRINNLASLYQAQGRYSEAEPLYQQALDISQRSLGNDHPAVATRLNNLASLYQDQGRYSEAEPLFRQSLATFEKRLGPEHPSYVNAHGNLQTLLEHQRKGSA